MTYLTPGEQEAELAAAFGAMLDAGAARLDEVLSMNRRVRAQLLGLIDVMRHAVDDGDREVMREALMNARITLGSMIDDGTIVIEWKGEDQ